jgi:1-acyl-sn-glycerol-3-phosphate acyltransferase
MIIFSIIWMIFFILHLPFLILPILWYLVLKIFAPERTQNKYINDVASLWGKLVIRSTGSVVEVTGKENLPESDNLLFVSNHQGFTDIPLILGYIPKLVGFIAKIELKRFPFLNLWMMLLGTIFLDRRNLRQSVAVFQKAAEKLKNGAAMVIFPEGTRSKGPTMRRFKRGSTKLALRTDVPVVPLTISGSYKMFEGNNYFVQPAKIRLHIHPPIHVEKLSEAERKNLAKILQEKIGTKLEELKKNDV